MRTSYQTKASSTVRSASGISPVQILVGDVRDVIKTIPDESINCCITSPPYWGMRDYGVDNQIGAEDDVLLYIQELTSLFRDVKRTLKNDGTLWLNISNTYTS